MEKFKISLGKIRTQPPTQPGNVWSGHNRFIEFASRKDILPPFIARISLAQHCCCCCCCCYLKIYLILLKSNGHGLMKMSCVPIPIKSYRWIYECFQSLALPIHLLPFRFWFFHHHKGCEVFILKYYVRPIGLSI